MNSHQVSFVGFPLVTFSGGSPHSTSLTGYFLLLMRGFSFLFLFLFLFFCAGLSLNIQSLITKPNYKACFLSCTYIHLP